jgi:hypothetical protein
VLFSALVPGGRALFFRTGGAEIGGRLSTVALDGSAERVVGDDATGTTHAADHDFGALSAGGRLFFEAELFEHAPPRIYVVEPGGAVRALSDRAVYTSIATLLQ